MLTHCSTRALPQQLLTKMSDPTLQPPARRIQAAVSLLTDSDPRVVAACRRQLLSWGEEARMALDMAVRERDPRLRVRARGILRTLDLQDWLSALEDAAQRFDHPGHQRADSLLLQGALLLCSIDQGRIRMRPRRGASYLGPALRMPPQGIMIEADLRRLGLELTKRIAGRSLPSAAKALSALMADEQDFTGGESSYFSPASVHIADVFHARRGIPVSLSILYLLVARWAGLSAAGVRMPDHFLVRLHGVRPVILDPFHRGRQVTKSDCVRYLRSAGYGNSTAEYTRDLADREVLAELCRCLARVYRGRGDREATGALDQALVMLQRDVVLPRS